MKHFFLLLSTLSIMSACRQRDHAMGGSPSSGGTRSDNTIAGAGVGTFPPICYVLCDFSDSQDAQSAADIVQNAITIYQKMNKTYKMKFISIDAAIFQKPFFEFEPLSQIEVLTAEEKKRRKKYSPMMAEQLNRKLDSIRAIKRPKNTCIIHAIGGIANDLVNNDAYQSVAVRIVVLSDMLEACSHNFGSINLEKQSMTEATRILKKMPKPTNGFNIYKDLKIALVASSGRPVNELDGQLNFWKQLFLKFGYDYKGAISASLPAWID